MEAQGYGMTSLVTRISCIAIFWTSNVLLMDPIVMDMRVIKVRGDA